MQLAHSKPLGEGVLQDCRRQLAAQRTPLVDAIFDGGTRRLAALMCVDRMALCDPHHVADSSGEL